MQAADLVVGSVALLFPYLSSGLLSLGLVRKRCPLHFVPRLSSCKLPTLWSAVLPPPFRRLSSCIWLDRDHSLVLLVFELANKVCLTALKPYDLFLLLANHILSLLP